MRYSWKVIKQTPSFDKYIYEKLLREVHPDIKLFGCLGRAGDLCILKNLRSGGICNLKCKWHGQYDLVDMDSNANFFKACSTLAKELPVFKKAFYGKYPHICNRSYPALNSKVTYRCVGNEKIGYHMYRQQTELELGRHS